MSASVKAYFALKMIGDALDAPHMAARARGDPGARRRGAQQRVHPRPARALRHHALAKRAGNAGRDHAAAALVSVPPVEGVVLGAHRAGAAAGAAGAEAAREKSARRHHRRTVHRTAAHRSARRTRRRTRNGPGSRCSAASISCCGRRCSSFPSGMRKRAIDRAVAFVTERLNGEDGLGAIFPAMANSVMMFDVLGDPAHAAHRPRLAREAAGRRRATKPIASPACRRCGTRRSPATRCWKSAASEQRRCRGLDWLLPRQVLDVVGDWAARRPDVRPGGWAFQYANPHYPDLDDTAVVVMAMDRARRNGAGDALRRGDRARRRMGEGPAEQQRRLGARSTSTIPTTTSTTSRSPITAR